MDTVLERAPNLSHRLLASGLSFAIACGWSWIWKLLHKVAAPVSFIGASNFFEFAVAVAIALFGLESGAALATVVGVLEEVPIMLSLVWIANRTRTFFTAKFEAGSSVPVLTEEQ